MAESQSPADVRIFHELVDLEASKETLGERLGRTDDGEGIPIICMDTPEEVSEHLFNLGLAPDLTPLKVGFIAMRVVAARDQPDGTSMRSVLGTLGILYPLES